ncbi:MAG: hypothetical protein ACQESG_05585 [Nanobdellota archaeon]
MEPKLGVTLTNSIDDSDPIVKIYEPAQREQYINGTLHDLIEAVTKETINYNYEGNNDHKRETARTVKDAMQEGVIKIFAYKNEDEQIFNPGTNTYQFRLSDKVNDITYQKEISGKPYDIADIVCHTSSNIGFR